MDLSSPCVAVVSALPEEIRALSDHVSSARVDSQDGRDVTVGTIASIDVVLMHTGTGIERARNHVATLLARRSIDALLFIGVAGALDPSLEVNALLAPNTVQHADGRTAPSPAQAWCIQILDATDARPGTLVTVDRVITTPEEKAALWEEWGAQGPAAIDMETFGVAQAASARDVPYLPLRVISDTADERLPDLLKDAQREDGGIDRTRVMRDLVWSPSAVPTLMRMRRRVRGASEMLAEAVIDLLRSDGLS